MDYEPHEDDMEEFERNQLAGEDEERETPIFGCACDNPLTVDTVCDGCIEWLRNQEVSAEFRCDPRLRARGSLLCGFDDEPAHDETCDRITGKLAVQVKRVLEDAAKAIRTDRGDIEPNRGDFARGEFAGMAAAACTVTSLADRDVPETGSGS